MLPQSEAAEDRPLRIFLSSTSRDLHEHRAAVLAGLRAQGHHVVAMEDFPAVDQEARDKCVEEICGCDLFVLLVGWERGSRPRGSALSFTEIEYDAAADRRIPRLVFLTDQHSAPDSAECRGADGQLVRAFRQRLQEERVVAYFTSPNNCRAEVSEAVARWLVRQRQEKREFVAGWLSGTVGQFFKDREEELDWLRQQVADEGVRLALVCGRGGLGKTALITRLVRDLTERRVIGRGAESQRVEGIVCVALRESQYRSPDKVVELLCRVIDPAAARQLREKWEERSPLSDKLEFLFCRTLREQCCLIVLDNLEDVLDAENHIREEFSDLARFVESCVEFDHAARLVATSRRTLLFSPDVEGRVGGRRVERSLEGGLPEQDCIALLRDLDAQDSVGILSAEEDMLRTVARRCWGVPRTLERLVGILRQKRIYKLSDLVGDEEWLARIADNSARELYESLDPDARLVVQALAVYDRAVSAEAVQHLLPDTPVLEILDALVRNYVVTYDGERFSSHPLDQQYAYRQIPETNGHWTRATLHSRAADFFHGLRRPCEEWLSIERVDPQLQECHHLVRAGAHDEACRVLNEIDREYLALWGHSALIIELRTPLVSRLGQPAMQELNLGNLGAAYLESGDPGTAIELYQQALAMCREIGNRADEGRWTGNIGVARTSQGEVRAAIALLEEGLRIADEIGDRLHQGRWLGNLGEAHASLGEMQQAIVELHQALEIAREIEDRRFRLLWSMSLGRIHQGRGELASAVDYLEEAAKVAGEIGAQRHHIDCLVRLGNCYALLEDEAKRVHCYEGALQIARDRRDLPLQRDLLVGLIQIRQQSGNLNAARDLCEEALAAARGMRDRVAEVTLLSTLATLWAQAKQPAEAEAFCSQALTLARESGTRVEEYALLAQMGDIFNHAGDARRAVKLYEEALVIVRDIGQPAEDLVLSLKLADVLAVAGHAEKAIPLYEKGLAFAREANSRETECHLLIELGAAHYFLERPCEAIPHYEAALALARELGDRQREAVALFDIGDAHHPAGNLSEAWRYYRASLAMDVPATSFKSANGLGVLCLHHGEEQEAQDYFEQAAELCQDHLGGDPRSHAHLCGLGLAQLATGKTEEGLASCRHALEVSSTPRDVRYALQDLLVLKRARGDIPGLDEAIGLFERTLSAEADRANKESQ